MPLDARYLVTRLLGHAAAGKATLTSADDKLPLRKSQNEPRVRLATDMQHLL